MTFDVGFNEVEIGSVRDDVVFPNAFDCSNEGMLEFDVISVKNIVCFSYDEA